MAKDCDQYTPVYHPTPDRERAGVCKWFVFHKKPCRPFYSSFYCQNGFHYEFDSIPPPRKKTGRVTVTKYRVLPDGTRMVIGVSSKKIGQEDRVMKRGRMKAFECRLCGVQLTAKTLVPKESGNYCQECSE